MTFAKKMTLTILFLAISFVAGSAQETTARFTLQHATSFAGTVLPAGSYRLQAINRGTLLTLITSTDKQSQALLLVPKSRDYDTPCEKSSLRMTSEGGEWSAASLCLAESAMTLYFGDRPRRAPLTAAALTGTP
jgi:hypothetical protein